MKKLLIVILIAMYVQSALIPTFTSTVRRQMGAPFAGDEFGTGISASDSYVVVSENSNEQLGAVANLTGLEYATRSERFGVAVGISSDTIAVSAPIYPSSPVGALLKNGAVYIYQLVGGVWQRNNSKAFFTGATTSEQAGGANRVQVGGSTIVVGSPTFNNGAGTVYVLGRNQNCAGCWGTVAMLNASVTEKRGFFTALNSAGTLAAFSLDNPTTVAAHVYGSSNSWTAPIASIPVAAIPGGKVAGAMALNSNFLMVADAGANSVYVYAAAHYSARVATLVPRAGFAGASFGRSLALNDANTVVVGAAGKFATAGG